MSKFFLGVDGGQSSTTALIGDENGRVVGFGRGGPCNHVGAAEGPPKFRRMVGGCVCATACEKAGLERGEFEAAFLGFSGGPEDKESLVREFVFTDKLKVTHDALIALSGACAGAPGIITIAGTGIDFVWPQHAAGTVARSGGWGYIFGDEGAGLRHHAPGAAGGAAAGRRLGSADRAARAAARGHGRERAPTSCCTCSTTVGLSTVARGHVFEDSWTRWRRKATWWRST